MGKVVDKMRSYMPEQIKSSLKNLYSSVFGKYKIYRHLQYAKTREPAPVCVVFGGHWSSNPGWLVLNEREQDITKRLRFPDKSVDVIFSEHVIEHVTFEQAIGFFKEANRILKVGGVFRVVCPMLDHMFESNLSGDLGKRYIKTSIIPTYSKENELLESLGTTGVYEDPKLFFFNNIFMNWGHKFIWSSLLLSSVLKQIGFTKVNKCEIGSGFRKDYCIERRNRGIYIGNSYQEDLKSNNIFDPESGVVECIK